MQLFSERKRHACFYKVTAALFIVILVLCSFGAGQMRAGAEGVTTFTVDTLADGVDGSLRAAIDAANITAGDFKIVIAVEGTLTASTALPVLNIHGRSGFIQSNPNATLTGFTCDIRDGGIFTLENVSIDNRAYDFATIVARGNPEDTLLLSGRNSIKGNSHAVTISVDGFQDGRLIIDRVPGGSDADSVLTLTDARVDVHFVDELALKGGTVESHGSITGIASGLWVTGGRLIGLGDRDYGITAYFIHGSTAPITIDGGTIVARGGISDIGLYTYLIINGGSFNAKTIEDTMHPVDGSGNLVYLVTVTVGDPSVKNTEVSCSVNGGASFSCVTDEEGKLYLWMPAGEGAAEIDTGTALYRASGTVEENYDNAMLAQLVPPVVTAVAVSPSSVAAVGGSSVQFSARVEGLYYPPQTVTWTVDNGHAGTSIDGSGLLTISTGETSRTLTVTATSTYDTGKSGTAQVSVVSAIAIAVGAILLLLLLVLLLIFL